METLIEKAKARKPLSYGKVITDEMVELALAWLKGEITTTQAATALETEPRNSYITLNRSLQVAYRKGRIETK